MFCKIYCHKLSLVLFHVKVIGFFGVRFFCLHVTKNDARLWNLTKRHVYFKLYELVLKCFVCIRVIMFSLGASVYERKKSLLWKLKWAQHSLNQQRKKNSIRLFVEGTFHTAKSSNITSVDSLSTLILPYLLVF